MGGTHKGLLPIARTPIVERELNALRQVADPVFIVAPEPAPFTHLGVRVVPDRLPGRGALGGIYTAILESDHDRVLVVACDMPFLNPALLQHMAGVRDADLVIPRSPGGLEPLCAIYTRRCAEPIRTRLDRGALEASVLPEGLKIQEVGPEILAAYDPDGLMFVNVNTPHDYERARTRVDSP